MVALGFEWNQSQQSVTGLYQQQDGYPHIPIGNVLDTVKSTATDS